MKKVKIMLYTLLNFIALERIARWLSLLSEGFFLPLLTWIGLLILSYAIAVDFKNKEE